MTSLRVLLIEDDENDAILIGHVLRHRWPDVDVSRVEGPSAFETALQEPWDVVLADFNLREFSGLDAVRTARALVPSLPVIVVSGSIGEEMAAQLMRDGARDFVRKSNLARLVPAIEREVAERGEHEARVRAEVAQAESERREQEALDEARTARKLERLRTRFLHTISHEIRNPLTSAAGYLELLRHERAGPLNEQQHDYIDRASHSIGKIQLLLADLLDNAAVEAGTFRIRTAVADLASLVREAIADVRPEAEAAHVAITVESPESVPAEIDRDRVGQVLANLLGNAVKFSPPGGNVQVRVVPSAEQVVVEIIDDGPGVRPADRSRLFLPFVRLEHGEQKPGLGLGLSVAKSIVQAHGGRIGLRDHGKTTFFVELPRRRPQLEAAAPPS